MMDKRTISLRAWKKAALALTCVAAGAVRAATVYVDAASTAAEPDGSAEKPYATIAAGVAAAAADDEVRLADGTYTLSAQVNLDKKVTVSGNPANRTAVTVDCQESCRAFETSASGATVANLTIVNGKMTGSSWGGGIS